MTKTKFIPALRFKWLTPLYDLLIGITMPETKIKRYLIEAASINTGSTVLDFGCGTGTLTIMAKETSPGSKVTGIDIDVQILNKAIQKVKETKMDIFLLDYDGMHLPFQRNAFDCYLIHPMQ